MILTSLGNVAAGNRGRFSASVEVTGARRRGALAARRKMDTIASLPGCLAVARPVGRPVRSSVGA